MILILDNYDSFTYNLYQIAGMINPDVRVVKNDELNTDEIEAMSPSHIIISPGPGRPRETGICEEVVSRMKDRAAILGVCLGHQAICEVFGGEIAYARNVMYGKSDFVQIANGSPVFRGLPPVIQAGLYHSLTVKRDSLPEELLIIAEDNEGEIMGIKHRDYEVYGVQFHPESILTQHGQTILENFLEVTPL